MGSKFSANGSEQNLLALETELAELLGLHKYFKEVLEAMGVNDRKIRSSRRLHWHLQEQLHSSTYQPAAPSSHSSVPLPTCCHTQELLNGHFGLFEFWRPLTRVHKLLLPNCLNSGKLLGADNG